MEKDSRPLVRKKGTEKGDASLFQRREEGESIPRALFVSYFAVYPPSTIRWDPVMNDASSDAKKRIAWAISLGSAQR